MKTTYPNGQIVRCRDVLGKRVQSMTLADGKAAIVFSDGTYVIFQIAENGSDREIVIDEEVGPETAFGLALVKGWDFILLTIEGMTKPLQQEIASLEERIQQLKAERGTAESKIAELTE